LRVNNHATLRDGLEQLAATDQPAILEVMTDALKI
jgi:hypothetical protein